ncbi:MAG: beta-mannosidase [Lachnospiraceae bacterium]|nr:beta-mannosidase [Lachnospiraceae bacterium]
MYDIKGERWKCLELELEKKVAPVNPDATKEAAELLDYLYHVAGNQIISGQHTQTNPMEEITYTEQLTGKKPKLRGFEMLSYSPNINYEDATEACLTEVYENRDTMETAIRWAKESGGIVTLSFHWFSPLGGRDKSFYAKNTDFDASKILQEGTDERNAFFADMERIGIVLKRFENEKIPVLWRPFHESDGEWFWWGAKGPEVARELYKLMFDYYTKQLHLDNLLWVWNCRLAEGYPGDEYVDVISVDVYLQEYEPTDYAEEYRLLVENTGCRKVAALAEIGYLPDVKMLQESRIPWAYFMLWSKEFCIGEQYNSKEIMKKVYQSEYVLTE